MAHAGFDTLDGLIRRDRRWLPALLDYASYMPNPALQVEATKIGAILVDRLPHFPDLLMQRLGTGDLALKCFTSKKFHTKLRQVTSLEPISKEVHLTEALHVFLLLAIESAKHQLH